MGALGHSRPLLVSIGVYTSLLLLLALGCGGDDTPATAPRPAADDPTPREGLSEMVRAGEALFNRNCSTCHGVGAVGTNQGPPLLDRVYHPGHHPDASFRNAVRNGVPAHHWKFGDMLPVPGVSAEEVDEIICYVRQTQRESGLFEGSAYSTVC